MIIQKVGGFRAYWYEVGKVCFSWWFLFFLVLSLSSVFFATTFGGVFVVASFLISLLGACFLVSRTWKVFWGTLGLLLVLMGIGYLGFYFIRDPSVDGNSYHAEMILGVLNGKSLFSLDWMYVRNTYYPKTIEVLFSGFSALTDTLDAGRILKLILIVLSGINVVQFLKSFPLAQSWKNWRWIGVFVFIIVVNPVVMYQFFTLYIDDVLYLLLVNFLMYVWLGNTKIALFVFALMVGAKLSYGFFGVLGLLVVIGSLACVRKVSFLNVVSACYQDLGKTSWVRILVLLMGIWVGLHQYLANAWNFHNPLYGFVGEGKKDIISMFQPPQMQKQSKFGTFFSVFFSYSRNHCVVDACWSLIDLTTSAGRKEFLSSYAALKFYDPNLNGFGNLYAVLLVLGGMALWWYLVERIVTKGSSDQRRKGVWMLIGYVVVGTLSLPFPWARYFPILYLLPLLLVLLVCRKWLVKVLVAVYLANSVMVAYFLVLEYGFMGKEKILQARFIHQLAMQQKSFREPQVVFSAEVTPSNLGIKLSQTYGFPLDALQELSEYELLEKCGVAEVVHSIVTCPNGGYLFTEIDFLKSRFYLP